MSSFPPPNWEVRFLKDMGSLACEVKDSTQPSMAAYLAVKPAGGEEGNFRFVLAGPHKIRLRFEIKNVLPSDLFNNMVAEAELEIGDQVVMERNSVCSAWMDLVELVRSQDVMITDGDDNDIATSSWRRCRSTRRTCYGTKDGQKAQGSAFGGSSVSEERTQTSS